MISLTHTAQTLKKEHPYQADIYMRSKKCGPSYMKE